VPASEKQIATNRANAAKSTGPRTAAGKAASRRNSLRHGVLSSVVVSVDEDPEAFEALLKVLIEEHDPQTQHEVHLVEKLTLLYWRERRLADAERRLTKMQKEYARRAREPVPNYIPLDYPFDGLTLENQLLVGRYQTMLNNQIAQTLAMLSEARAQRLDQAPDPIDGEFEVMAADNDDDAAD
jgi:hypothetical protein